MINLSNPINPSSIRGRLLCPHQPEPSRRREIGISPKTKPTSFCFDQTKPLIEAKLPDYPQWRKKVTQETKIKSMGCKNGEIPILKKEQEREGEKKR
jgi:hypothetical protein